MLVPGDTIIADASGMQVAVVQNAGDRKKKIHLQPGRKARRRNSMMSYKSAKSKVAPSGLPGVL